MGVHGLFPSLFFIDEGVTLKTKSIMLKLDVLKYRHHSRFNSQCNWEGLCGIMTYEKDNLHSDLLSLPRRNLKLYFCIYLRFLMKWDDFQYDQATTITHEVRVATTSLVDHMRRVVGHYSVVNWPPIFEWYTTIFVVKNGYSK